MEISNAAQELARFFSVLGVARDIAINRMGDFPRMFKVIGLTGNEGRRLKEVEIDAIIKHYRYFNSWMKKNGFIDEHNKLIHTHL